MNVKNGNIKTNPYTWHNGGLPAPEIKTTKKKKVCKAGVDHGINFLGKVKPLKNITKSVPQRHPHVATIINKRKKGKEHMHACTPLRSQLFWSTTCCAVKTHNGKKVSLQPLKKAPLDHDTKHTSPCQQCKCFKCCLNANH